MRDLNKVQLIGHLGHDPDVRFLDNGTALTTFNIATNHSYTIGEDRQTETEWHRCAAWSKARRTLRAVPPQGQPRVCGRPLAHPPLG